MFNRLRQRILGLEPVPARVPAPAPAEKPEVTPEAVVWAYRLLLDREPESPQAVATKVSVFHTFRALRDEFLHSAEFRRNNQRAMQESEPPMSIEDVQSEAELLPLFEHIQSVWHHLGETEPHWSVLTAERFKQESIRGNEADFYDSGRQDADTLLGVLARNGIDYTSLKSCLDYGCGIGRVTRWLAERFERVYGYDISRAHLQSAKAYLAGEGIRNVTLCHLKQIQDLENLPKVDLIYSHLVLQHNPPPIIGLIVRQFMRALKEGGVAYFQIPTYKLGYRFSLSQYLSEGVAENESNLEMHALPQSRVFDIVRQEGGIPIEVFEDGCLGFGYGAVSNTFLVQKT